MTGGKPNLAHQTIQNSSLFKHIHSGNGKSNLAHPLIRFEFDTYIS